LTDAFERGWSLVKMASYKVGPTEFWDFDERERSWQEDTGETYGEGKYPLINYFPIGGSPPPHPNWRTQVMIKPQDYLRLTSPIRDLPGWSKNSYGSKLQDYLWSKKYNMTNSRTDKIREWMKEGKPTYLPFLQIRSFNELSDEFKPREVVGHEGRHRMAAILQLLGNHPVPVQLDSKYFPNMRNKIEGMKLQGQFDEKQKLLLKPEMFNVGDVE